jgi:hypothetical protein
MVSQVAAVAYSHAVSSQCGRQRQRQPPGLGKLNTSCTVGPVISLFTPEQSKSLGKSVIVPLPTQPTVGPPPSLIPSTRRNCSKRAVFLASSTVPSCTILTLALLDVHHCPSALRAAPPALPFRRISPPLAGEAISLCGALLLLLVLARCASVLPILWLHNWAHASKLSATDMIIIWWVGGRVGGRVVPGATPLHPKRTKAG